MAAFPPPPTSNETAPASTRGLCAACHTPLRRDGLCPACTLEGALAPTEPEPAPPLPRAFGSFEVVRAIGRGGMGLVYEGRDPKLDRRVALKVLPEALAADNAALEQFEAEMKTVARLSHPNVVTAYQAGEDDGVHYLAMEYIPGSNLHERVAAEGAVPPAEAVDWVLQAARGLVCAHHAGVVHRDVKPGNLYVDPQGTLKILDLGLAQLVAKSSGQGDGPEGAVLGTAEFMAPEQAADPAEVDPRADIYSLGCTLYFLLTGCSAFKRDSHSQTLRAHCQTPLPRLAEHAPAAASLQQICERMTAKDPADRHPSMEAVIADLEAWQRDGKGSRRRVALALAGVALLLAALGGWWFADRDGGAAQPAPPAPPPDPRLAQYGLQLHNDDWALERIVALPRARLTAARFHPVDGSLHYAVEWMRTADGRKGAGGIFRAATEEGEKAAQLLSAPAFNFAFSPSGERLFYQHSWAGRLGEFDVASGQTLRVVDMTPANDDPSSPRFPPPWYRGAVTLGDGEYLFTEFGHNTPGGIWKFGSGLEAPVELLRSPDRSTRPQGLAFGQDAIYVITAGAEAEGGAVAPGGLHCFTGEALDPVPTDQPLRLPGSLAWDERDGSLLYADHKGEAISRIALAEEPSQPAMVSPLISGFRELNFAAIDLSPDGERLLVSDFGRRTVFVFGRR